jgi:DNA integrity scanning protein DisA with diadenylate cyclase activity
VDFVVLAPSIYLLLRWSRDARALRVTIGILGLEVGALIAGHLDLVITVWVLHAAAVGAGVVLIVLFQPELRHALNTLEVVLKRSERRGALSQALEVVSAAAFSLAGAGRGALLVLTRHDSVNELLPGGVPVGGHVSPEILEASFRKVSPVHDAGTIVEGDRITRVGALLPLSQNEKLPRTWGTHHRARMGLAERSDAIVVVASEERGEVTLMHDGAFRRVDSADAMLIELKTLFAPEPTVRSTRCFRRSELLLQSVAIALAVGVVAATSLVAGTIVRVRTVPIEVVNLEPGLRIVDQSAVAAQVRPRGSSWALDSMEGALLTARADAQNLSEGVQEISLRVPGPLPPSVTVEAISPERITFRLQSVKDAGVNSKPGP